jgi:hypothetical protein
MTNQTHESYKNLIINYIGIGLFLFLTLSTLGGLFNIVIDKWLLFFKLDFNIIFWTKEILNVSLFIAFAFIFRNFIKKKDISNKKDFYTILITISIVYVFSSILQFIIPFMMTEKMMMEIYKEQVNYNNQIRLSSTYLYLPYILHYVKYGIAIKLFISKLE